MTYPEPQYLLLSTQRCGTTLLHDVLNCHSCLAMSEEAHWLPDLLRGGKQYQRFFETSYTDCGPLQSGSRWRQASTRNS